MVEIIATKRAAKTAVAQDQIPAVMYGRGEETVSLSVSKKDFTKAFAEAGESSTITLVVDGVSKNALIQDVSRDPVKSTISHADFRLVSSSDKVHVSVPVVFGGESPAVKAGLMLVKVMHELPVYGPASMLPHEVSIDISLLTSIDSVIHAGDIALPEGVTLYHLEASEVVAAINVAEELASDAPAADIAAIEVVKKGKKEEIA